MSDMIERLARAMCDDAAGRSIANQDAAPSYDDSEDHVQGYWQTIARAALEALREPTEEMVRAGVEIALEYPIGGTNRWPDYVRAKHQAMIDRAIER